jgi:NitT/TauT family transport system substrate-binding protein
MRTVTELGGDGLSRRRFVASASALGAACFLGVPRAARAEPPPETTKVRLVSVPATCLAPLYLAGDLLRLEGFSEIEYVQAGAEPGPSVLASGRADFSQWDVAAAILLLDAGKPIILLAGVHAGCQELMAHDRVRAIRELKGKRIAISAMGNADHINLSIILAYVGIDPRKEVTWIAGSEIMDSMKLFTSGEADAFLGFAPQPQEVRKQKVGHTIVDTLQDRPWSQYYCCTLIGNRDFVRANPIAAKRVLRALLKAADLCANEPERAAR